VEGDSAPHFALDLLDVLRGPTDDVSLCVIHVQVSTAAS
jgi:hypothetical protein